MQTANLTFQVNLLPEIGYCRSRSQSQNIGLAKTTLRSKNNPLLLTRGLCCQSSQSSFDMGPAISTQTSATFRSKRNIQFAMIQPSGKL